MLCVLWLHCACVTCLLCGYEPALEAASCCTALRCSAADDSINPGSLNSWLKSNKGYLCIDGDCNNLRLDAPDKLSTRITLQGESPKPSAKAMQASLKTGDTIYIAHVHDSGHFVLVTGWNDTVSGVNVNDPFYNSTSYPYDQVSDVISYGVSPPIQYNKDVNTPDTVPTTAVIPFKYPLYKQCDPRWGKDVIVSTTVCAVGCLMSSTSMAIGGKDITVAGHSSNPGSLNSWLKANGGYTSGNDLIESVIPKVDPRHISWPADAMHPTNNIPVAHIVEYLKQGRPVIANVMKGAHFVLVTGWEGSEQLQTNVRGGDAYAGVDTLYVNDPGFNRDTYSYSNDVVGWRLFNMTMSG